MYGLRTLTPQPSQYGQATIQRDILQPETGAVIGAFAEEATSGIGTFAADRAAGRVKELEKTGSPLTEEQYKSSPNFSVPYYRGITEESAAELKKFDDQSRANAELISAASSGQFALGLSAGFVAGVFEPKNVATGLATSMVLTPLAGGLVPAASSLRRLMKLRATANNYGGKVALGAVEGGVSAAIAEPSNRYSAKILRQDYTMADTAWNIALSTAFGVGASAAGIGAKEVPKFVRDKLDRFKADTMNVVAHEIDTATNQLAMGQRVDVAHVESLAVGDIAKKPISEQAKAAEQFVRYTETPEFKTRFEGSKVVDDNGAPLMVYKAMYPYDWTKETATSQGELITRINRTTDFPAFNKDEKGVRIAGFFGDMKTANQFASRGGSQQAIYPTYLKFEKPHIIDAAGKKAGEIQFGEGGKPFRDAIRSGQYDGVIIKNTADEGDVFVALLPDQIISAFGADDFDAIKTRLASENKASITKAIDDSLHPDNDTAIDAKAIAELEAFEESLALKKDEAALEEYNAYLKEVSAMKRQGLLSEADEIEMMDAINSVDEKELNKAYEALQICLTRG